MKKLFVLVFIVLFLLSIVGFATDKKSSVTDGKQIAFQGTEGDIATTSSGWVTWKKNKAPAYSGPHHLVGDPSVIKDELVYRMFYNCYDPEKSWGAVCELTSPDGLLWKEVQTNDTLLGRVIKTRSDDWDTAHETPLIYKYKGEYLLYFTGYVHKGDFGTSFPYHIGLATSRDGVKFERLSSPVFSPTAGGQDNDAVFSPTITEYNEKLVMLYTGMCMKNCPELPGVNLLAATSDDGKTWTKINKPVISKAEIIKVFPKAKDGVAESDIVRGPDGNYYLFMSLLYGKGNEIGVARSKTPFGPWDINPETIVKMTANSFDSGGALAPSVIIENNKVRMWYHGFGKKSIDIGYAETSWPLKAATKN